jgi:hypothetical protein
MDRAFLGIVAAVVIGMTQTGCDRHATSGATGSVAPPKDQKRETLKPGEVPHVNWQINPRRQCQPRSS